MERRKIYLLAAALLIAAMPLWANVCIEVYQASPECTEGCITAAQMAVLLNITLMEATTCLEELAFNGRLEHCGSNGYCRG
jgi:hypothetical protein